MKTIQLMLLLSMLSAGILRASDEYESQLEPIAYAVAPAAASGIGGWLSSFQRPSWLSTEGLGRGLAYVGGQAESAASGLVNRLGLTPQRVTGWIGSTPERSMEYLQSKPGVSYLMNNPRVRQQALAAALIGLPAAYYGYSKWRGPTQLEQLEQLEQQKQRRIAEHLKLLSDIENSNLDAETKKISIETTNFAFEQEFDKLNTEIDKIKQQSWFSRITRPSFLRGNTPKPQANPQQQPAASSWYKPWTWQRPSIIFPHFLP